MNTLAKFSLALSFVTLPLHGQSGDKENPEDQKDPIPADQIPPAPYLNKEQALKSFQIADGFVLENIAEQSLHQPVCLSFDADGRAWVVEMTNYMLDTEATGENLPAGRIKVFEDTNGDGSLDKSTVFLDKLILPRACAVTSDGLLYAHKDQLFFIKRGGDDGLTPVGEPELVDENYAAGGNAEHKPNGLLLARDNWYYNAKARRRYRRVEGEWLIEKTAFRGQWGIAQDDAGRLFYNNNSTLLMGDKTRPNLYRQNAKYTPKHSISGRVGTSEVYPIRMNPGVNRAYTGKILNKEGKLIKCTGAAGMAVYRGENFPEQFYGTAFISEPCGNLIKAIDIDYADDNTPEGSFTFGKNEFLASTDEWFRPVNIYTAPDGTLWFLDIYMGLIQHEAYMTTYLRKQYLSRGLDKPEPDNGRIYRVRYEKNKVSKAPKMSKFSIAQLQNTLNHKNGTVRDNAQRLIVERITTDEKALAEWNTLNAKVNYKGYALLHALWIYESVNTVPTKLIKEALASSDTDIVNSALELAVYADAPVNDLILKLKPSTKTAHSYVYALGKLGSSESHANAVATISKFKKSVKQLEELYVSGLGSNATTILANKLAVSKSLEKLLKDAGKKAKVVTGPVVPEKSKKDYEHGKTLYQGAAACSGCHGLDGLGQASLFPPLASSEWVNGNPDVLAKIILHGLEGPVKVNGVQFDGAQAMPAYKQRTDLTDKDLASLMTYIRYMKGNKGGVVSADQVQKVREATKGRVKSYTEADLRGELK